MKLSGDQRATIVENDEQAVAKLRALYASVKQGEISIERAARLRANIEGNAIERWRNRCGRSVSIHEALLEVAA